MPNRTPQATLKERLCESEPSEDVGWRVKCALVERSRVLHGCHPDDQLQTFSKARFHWVAALCSLWMWVNQK